MKERLVCSYTRSVRIAEEELKEEVTKKLIEETQNNLFLQYASIDKSIVRFKFTKEYKQDLFGKILYLHIEVFMKVGTFEGAELLGVYGARKAVCINAMEFLKMPQDELEKTIWSNLFKAQVQRLSLCKEENKITNFIKEVKEEDGLKIYTLIMEVYKGVRE